MRPLPATFALAALAAMTAALAQQTTTQPPSTDTPPPAHSTSPPANPSADPSSSGTDGSQTDKATLMKRCMAQVQASNPGVPENDVKQFCAKEVYRPPPQ